MDVILRHAFFFCAALIRSISTALSPTWLIFLAAVHRYLQTDIYSKGWHEKEKKRGSERASEGIAFKVHAICYEIAAVCVSCPSKQSSLAEEDRC